MTLTQSRTRTFLIAVPWILVLVITGSVQVLRGDAAVDAVVFFAVAILLTLDAAGIGVVTADRPFVSIRWILAVAAAVAVVVMVAPRHGAVATAVVGAVGVVTVGLTWFDPPALGEAERDEPELRQHITRAAVCWSAILVALCLIELYSYLVGRGTDETQYAHPAISDLVDPLLDTPPGRVFFAVAWTGTGILLLTRGRKRNA